LDEHWVPIESQAWTGRAWLRRPWFAVQNERVPAAEQQPTGTRTPSAQAAALRARTAVWRTAHAVPVRP
jgi:hypothetical protein